MGLNGTRLFYVFFDAARRVCVRGRVVNDPFLPMMAKRSPHESNVFWVSNSKEVRIVKLSDRFELLRKVVQDNGTKRYHAMRFELAAREAFVLMHEYHDPEVRVYNIADGTFFRTFALEPGFAADFAIDRHSSSLFVLSRVPNSLVPLVRVYTNDGAFLRSWAIPIDTSPNVRQWTGDSPFGYVAVSNSETTEVFVAVNQYRIGGFLERDTPRATLQVFDADGRFLRTIGNDGPHAITDVYGLALDNSGHLLVLNEDIIKLFMCDGEFVMSAFTVPSQLRWWPTSVSATDDGTYYVVDKQISYGRKGCSSSWTVLNAFKFESRTNRSYCNACLKFRTRCEC